MHLQVTSSCTSVYVDGSETRGALEAVVNVKYGSFSGSAHFTIWMPKLPLHIEMDDTKLSQIKGWRVPIEVNSITGQEEQFVEAQSHQSPSSFFTRRKRSKSNGFVEEDETSDNYSNLCGPRYQQTNVHVFAEFLAEDPDSGRKEYFPVRGTQLDVTELLVGRSLRITNNRIATLRGNVIQGRLPGKTEIKVYTKIFTLYLDYKTNIVF